MLSAALLFAIAALLAVVLSAAEIYDPLNVFCGSFNCYDLLEIQRNASGRDIKKSFRKLSLALHPDKNKAENATDAFRALNKAYEVLTGNESRPLFDYYLDHPKDYYTVSGQHYIRNLPKSDVRMVLVLVLAIACAIQYAAQLEKYKRAVNYLRNSTLNNLSLKEGGTKQTLELYRRASEMYDVYVKEQRAKGDKSAGKAKSQDPMFLQLVEQVVGEVKIEGGYRKPVWRDLLAWQLVILPHTLWAWARKYHRRYISTAPLPLEDKLEMSQERLGMAYWMECSEEEQAKFVEKQIWKPEVFAKFVEDEEAKLEQAASSKKGKARRGKGLRRRGKMTQGDDDNDEEYVE